MVEGWGHGAPSHIITGLQKSMVDGFQEPYRRKKSDTILHSDRVLKQVSEMIERQDLGKYLTMFYGVLNDADSTMTYSNGGHYPRPILFDGQRARFLEERNLPVGLFRGTEYTSSTIDMPKSFLMAMFSDGVFVILSQEGMENQKNYLLSLIDSMDVSMGTLVEELDLDSVEAPPDDITLLLIKREG